MEINRGIPAKKVVKQNQNALLKSILIITILVTFTILLVGGYWIFKEQAPRPVKVTNESGDVLFSKQTIIGGQAVWQKYGLMDYGTVLGDGSYMGPDYTAEALKIYTEGMQDFRANEKFGKTYSQLNDDQKSIIKNNVMNEIRKNRYDSSKDTLKLTDAQSYGLEKVRAYYKQIFTKGDGWGLKANLIKDSDMPKSNRVYVANGDQIKQISDFFFWTAWLSSTVRPGDKITYTNNWPYYEDAGNHLSFSAIWWSGASVTILILAIGIILYFYKRYQLNMKEAYTPGNFPEINVSKMPVTNSQVKSGKYFVVVAALFFVQCMFGALLAHYYTEPQSFFGIKWIHDILPFNIAKGYHLQLAVFWIATAWLGRGSILHRLLAVMNRKNKGYWSISYFGRSWYLLAVV
jgi:nitric oxide reductase subunit B